MKYNLNNEYGINLNKFDFGKTQNVEIKVGRKSLMMDIDKNSSNAFISIYNKLDKDRSKYTKYGKEAKLCVISMKNNVFITKDIINDRFEIEKAQEIINKYDDKLD